MNLELEREYGKQVWTAHLQQVEDCLVYTRAKSDSLTSTINELNRKRQFSQMNEYDTFHRMHNKVHGLYAKNIELEKECMRMEG